MIHEDLNIRTKKDEIYEEVIFVIRYLTSKGFYAVGDQSDDDTVERIMNNSGGWIEFATHGLTAGRVYFEIEDPVKSTCWDVARIGNGADTDDERARLMRLDKVTGDAGNLYATYEKVRQVFHRPLCS